MAEQKTVLINEKDAQVVRYSTSERGRRDGIADASKESGTKFSFSEGQAAFLARRQASQLRKA